MRSSQACGSYLLNVGRGEFSGFSPWCIVVPSKHPSNADRLPKVWRERFPASRCLKAKGMVSSQGFGVLIMKYHLLKPAVSRTVGFIILSMFGQNPLLVTRHPFPSAVWLQLWRDEWWSRDGGGMGIAGRAGITTPWLTWEPQGWQRERSVGLCGAWLRMAGIAVKLNSASRMFLRDTVKVPLVFGTGWSCSQLGTLVR